MHKITPPLLLAFPLSDFDASSQSEKILLAPVKIEGKWGYINKTGKIVIKLQFDEARGFREGLANIKLDSKWGYINKTGKIVINPRFDMAWHFEEGLAVIGLDGKLGYIDKT